MKESFILHTNAWPAIKDLNYEQRGRLFSAIMCYQVGEDPPEMDAETVMAFKFIASQLDRDREKYEAISERRRQAANERWNKQKMQVHNLHYDNENVNDNDNGNDNVNENENDNDTLYEGSGGIGAAARPTTTPGRWAPPSLEEVEDYVQVHNLRTSGAAFYDYYSAKGWQMGRSKMKDWQAALRSWARKEPKPAGMLSLDEIFKGID